MNSVAWLNSHIWRGDLAWRFRHTSHQHLSWLAVARHNTCNEHNKTTTQDIVHLSSYTPLVLHSWKLERWSPSSLEHPINKHPVFSKASEVEFPRARAIFSRRKYLKVPPGDEAWVSHADVHRTLWGVPTDGYRPFLHQILEFSALKPGYRRHRHPACDRHLL